MNERLKQILKLFLNNEQLYFTSTQIAEHLDVSTRTIKRYIWELDGLLQPHGANIDSCKSGYCLMITNQQLFGEYQKEFQLHHQNLNIDNDDSFNIIKLLLTNSYITQDQISDQLFISRSSINKYIGQVKLILKENGIIVSNRPHYGYYLIGEEKSIRNYMVKICHQDIKADQISGILQDHIKGNYQQFYQDVIAMFKATDFVKFDDNMNYFMHYMMVSVCRIQQGFTLASMMEHLNLSTNHRDIVNQLATLMQQHFQIRLNEKEKLYISYLMGNSYLDDCEMDQLDDSLFERIVDDFISEIARVYQADFSYDDILRKGLIQHLYTSYSRFYINAVLVNPIVDMIKSKYIEAYNYAVVCSKILKDHYHLNTSEDDIGYLALHFAAANERIDAMYRYQAIVVCGSGHGTAELLKVRLKNRISNLDIVGVYSSLELEKLDLSDIFVILTTIPLEQELIHKPIILVNSLLPENDVQYIKEYIANYKDIHLLKKVFSPTLFFPHIKMERKSDVIDFVSNQMLQQGYIGKEQMVSIQERETMSSTEINDLVAIPHCIVSNEYQTIFSIATLEKPIHWGKTEVQLIFFGVIATNSTVNKKIFPLLYKLTSDKRKVKELMKLTNYEQFIDAIFRDIPVEYTM